MDDPSPLSDKTSDKQYCNNFGLNIPYLTREEALYVRAAKQLELEVTMIDMQFYYEVLALRVKFQDKLKVIHEKRARFISGEIPVNEDDIKCSSLIYMHDHPECVVDNLEQVPGSKGIPKFWLNVLLNCLVTDSMIEDHDVCVLEHLVNIESTVHMNPPGFSLRFTFDFNEYFEPNVLEKQYFYKITPSTEPPYLFDGPILEKCTATEIHWKKNKNPTIKLIKRKQKNIRTKKSRLVTKRVHQDSFFHFFRSELNSKVAEVDHHIAIFFRDEIIPHATIYYTGEQAEHRRFNKDYDENSLDGYRTDENLTEDKI